jgi:SAM-dependent methyltransferase
MNIRQLPMKMPFRGEVTPTRRDKILANLDLMALCGMEIGALATPLVSTQEGEIIYVDHTDTDTLRKKYANDISVDKNEIVNVDAVWGMQTLQDCIGKDKKVDYVVASHVVEHVPDLITWLSEIYSVLKPNGTLRLAVPDRRYTFDYLRSESYIFDVLDAFIRKARAPLPRAILENHHLSCVIDVNRAWSGTLDLMQLVSHNSIRNGLVVASDVLQNGTYHDTHCWVFTPVSFVELCIEMAELDLFFYVCEYFIETQFNEFEFYVSMRPSKNKKEIISSWEKIAVLLINSKTDQQST